MSRPLFRILCAGLGTSRYSQCGHRSPRPGASKRTHSSVRGKCERWWPSCRSLWLSVRTFWNPLPISGGLLLIRQGRPCLAWAQYPRQSLFLLVNADAAQNRSALRAFVNFVDAFAIASGIIIVQALNALPASRAVNLVLGALAVAVIFAPEALVFILVSHFQPLCPYRAVYVLISKI